MTVSTISNKDEFTGTGANTSLPTTFPFITDTDLVVIKRVTATGVETVLALATHYTVAGGDRAIGVVTPVDGATDFPTTVTWIIKRNTPKTQSANYVENDNFGAEMHEGALDKATYLAQDSQEEVGRALKVAVSDPDPGLLPTSVERASSYMGFDAAGDPVALSAPTDTSITTAWAKTLLDDPHSTAARATLGVEAAVVTNRGDMIRGSSAPAAERLALGGAGTYLHSDGLDAAWTALTHAEVWAVQALPRSYLAGLTITRTSATEFNTSKGEARCGSNTDQNLRNAKSTNAAFGKLFLDPSANPWAAGDGNPGVALASGFAAAIDTWHYFILVDADDPSNYDFGWDTSLIAVNLRGNAAVVAALGISTKYRRLASFVSTATPDFPDFTQIGDEFLLAVPVLDYDDVVADITASTTVTLASIPDGIQVKALLRISHLGATDKGFNLRSAAETDAEPSTTVAPLGALINSVTLNAAGGNMEEWTNDAQQVFIRKETDATTDTYIVTRGWVDRRGRDD